MANKPLDEAPPEAKDPVTLVYFHNHFTQLTNWLNSLKWKFSDDQEALHEVQKLLDQAQDIVRDVHDRQPEEDKRKGV